jgi:hypothetical protein
MDAQTHIANTRKTVEHMIATEYTDAPETTAEFMGLADMTIEQLRSKRRKSTFQAHHIFNTWTVRTANDRRQRDSFIQDCLYEVIAIERHIEGRK